MSLRVSPPDTSRSATAADSRSWSSSKNATSCTDWAGPRLNCHSPSMTSNRITCTHVRWSSASKSIAAYDGATPPAVLHISEIDPVWPADAE